MAVVSYAVSPLLTWKDKAHVISWPSMANGDVGQALEMPGSADRSVQVVGTFGSGGNLRVQGSNDVDTGYSVRDALKLILSAVAGKVSGAETTTITFRNLPDDKNRIVATVDANGNRSSVTYDVS